MRKNVLRRLAPALLAASLGVWASLWTPSKSEAQTPTARRKASLRSAFLLSTALLLGVWAERSEAQTPTAVIIPNGYTQFTDANGKPLTNGTVFFYTPGTTTPKMTWQDPYQSIINSNPVVLNGSGEALIWGSGIYRQMVYDVNQNLIWDQLTGGYNCVGGGTVPLGANGALQYNNNGIFGGLPLGNSSEILYGNASGPPTWGPAPAFPTLGTGVAAALALPLDGTGALVAQTGADLESPTINNGTLNNPTLNGGTWNNPTFTGTITGLPSGAVCHDQTGATLPLCIGSSDIYQMFLTVGIGPSGLGVYGYTSSEEFAWSVYASIALANQAAANVQMVPSIETEVQTLEHEVSQIATATHVKLK
jgi:hypothetical protein